MRRWTDAFIEIEVGKDVAIAPASADALVQKSRLLTEIARFDSSLVYGPLRREAQHWTPSGISAYMKTAPNEELFKASLVGKNASTKPHGFGLYTSTASVAGISMWRAFLGFGDSRTRPIDRSTWGLKIDSNARVAEITSAQVWADFISCYASVEDGLMYPDWSRIASEFDGIHITLATVAAAQGFRLLIADGVVAPAFWDVETTIWLNWCFVDARLVGR